MRLLRFVLKNMSALSNSSEEGFEAIENPPIVWRNFSSSIRGTRMLDFQPAKTVGHDVSDTITYEASFTSLWQTSSAVRSRAWIVIDGSAAHPGGPRALECSRVQCHLRHASLRLHL